MRGAVSLFVPRKSKQGGAPARTRKRLNQKRLRWRQTAHTEENDGTHIVQCAGIAFTDNFSRCLREVFVIVVFPCLLPVLAIEGNRLSAQSALPFETVESVFAGVAQLPECAAQAHVR